MQTIITELEQLVKEYTNKFSHIEDSVFSLKLSPAKWSKKEIVGHLIDSGHNNLRRFIAGQTEVSPHIVYDQNFWVEANNYQNMKNEEIVFLWKLINERICAVLSNMRAENYNKPVNTGKENSSEKTIQWLAEDYVNHLKHHINQIFPGTFNIAYT
ncbi:MAG: DinB family protein [Chitinophagales bacterium]|nr:DinB family protein [Chitinophagales bacterium]